MPIPPSVTKIKKDGIEFTSSVDRVQYTIHELARAALRDVGKLICRRFKQKYYQTFKRRQGQVGRFTQYWVRKNQKVPDLQVGIKPGGFYGGFQEVGTSSQPKLGLLSKTAQESIAEIVEIESKYLSALENEATALSMISEEEYEGGGDDGDT